MGRGGTHAMHLLLPAWFLLNDCARFGTNPFNLSEPHEKILPSLLFIFEGLALLSHPNKHLDSLLLLTLIGEVCVINIETNC